MFHIVTNANRAQWADEIRAMHETRARIFVEEYGWKLPLSPEGLEIDDYDDARAIYFLDFDEEEKLVSAQRVRPTGDKSLIGDHFPSSILVEGDFFSDTTWEMSRGFVVPEHRGRKRQDRRALMRLAILETALAAGVERLLTFSNTSLLPYFLNSAYLMRMLGLPIVTESGEGIATEMEVSARAVAHMRERLNLADAALLSDLPRGAHIQSAADVGRALGR